jgi:hypothetical protein
MGKVSYGVEQVSDILFKHYAENLHELEVLSRKECLFVLAFADTYGIRTLVQLSLDIELSPAEIESIMVKLEVAGFISRDTDAPGEFRLTYAGRGILRFHGFHWNTPLGKPQTGRTENGIVKWVDRSNSYGFIERSDGEEIYFEFSAIRKSSPPGKFNPPSFGIEGSRESESGFGLPPGNPGGWPGRAGSSLEHRGAPSSLR